MKTWYFSGEITLQSPLHLGSGESNEFINSLILRHTDGNPLIPGTSLGGVMAAAARNILRRYGCTVGDAEKQPLFHALFGSAGGKDSRGNLIGRESRLVVRDASLITASLSDTFTQDGNSINRKRGGAKEHHLFHDEVTSARRRFQFACELRERMPVHEETTLSDPNAEALDLLLRVLHLFEKGWIFAGGKRGSGHGEMKLENLTSFFFERTNPKDVLAFALGGADGLKGNTFDISTTQQKANAIPISVVIPSGQKCLRVPEVLVIRGVLRPLEPILVKTGVSLENVTHRVSKQGEKNPIDKLHRDGISVVKEPTSIDSAFCRNAEGLPYLPGSSIRGCFRSHAEKMVRTFIYEKFRNDEMSLKAAWDVETLKKLGKTLAKEKDAKKVYGKACIVSKLFGFTAMGGRVSFSDAMPLDQEKFECRLKLIDNVAIDRFTGGGADQKKFNARPYFPSYDSQTNHPDDYGDLSFRIVIEEFEPWHLGLLALLLKDLHNGRIVFGYGKTKGYGKAVLLPDKTTIEALTGQEGHLHSLCTTPTDIIGGFIHIPKTPVPPGTNFWASPQTPLYQLLQVAVEDFRRILKDWTDTGEKATQTAGGTI